MRVRLVAGGLSMALLLASLLLVSAPEPATTANGPEPLPDVSRVTAGDTHTCAEWWQGASCWGGNDEGKLGNGTLDGLLLAPQAPPTMAPAPVLGPLPALTSHPFGGLDAGPTRTCAIATGDAGTSAGEAWCWGGSEGVGLGRICGFGEPHAEAAPGVVWQGPPGDEDGPALCGTAPLAPVFSVAVAEHRSCALVGSPYDGNGGEVWCWDDLGGRSSILAHPLLWPDDGPLAGFATLDGAFDGFCGITVDRDVWCWDDGAELPARVEGVTEAVAVSVGGDHACAQVRDGSVWCWGANDQGQLGDGTTTTSRDPVRVTGLDETTPADPGDRGGFPWWRPHRILAAGRAHTCVLRDELAGGYEDSFERQDAVFCWGANDRGQLGDGSHDLRASAVRVFGLDPAAGVFDLALGADHSCVVTGETASVSHPDPTMGGIYSLRTLRCWGANDHGQLGTGDRVDWPRPALVVMTQQPRLAASPA